LSCGLLSVRHASQDVASRASRRRYSLSSWMEDRRRPSDNSFDLLVLGLPTIQELSFVAGRIEKPSAAISKDRLSLRHGAATQANPLRCCESQHPVTQFENIIRGPEMLQHQTSPRRHDLALPVPSRHALASRAASCNAIIALT